MSPVAPDADAKPDLAAPLIEQILGLMSEVATKFEPRTAEHRAWMLRRCDDPQLLDLLPSMTLTMFRVLRVVAAMGPVNGITVAAEAQIPKGSVSKAARRLVTLKMLEKTARPHNKKEILYHATELGAAMDRFNSACDEHMTHVLVGFLQRYDADEIRFMLRVLGDLLATPFFEDEPVDSDTQKVDERP